MASPRRRTNKAAVTATAKVWHFKSPAEWRRWLAKNHRQEGEMVLRLMRKHASDRGIGYAEALDEALCFGWIDGVRRSHDADSFTTRFTRRRARSIWSLVNIAHVKRLIAAGHMRAPGLAAFAARSSERQGVYSFERQRTVLAPALARRLRANKKARAFFDAQPPGYRRASIHWVMSAKRQPTRDQRLSQLISDSAQGLRIALLRR